MTQPSRTTETINRDNAAIRDIMHQIRELTVPDRATLAVGLVGHLATMMNRSQMAKLMKQLQEEAERVQDVPPSRQREDQNAADAGDEPVRKTDRDDGGVRASGSTKRHGDVLEAQVTKGAGDSRSGEADSRGREADPRRLEGNSREGSDPRAGNRHGVGQAGRGEFRSGRLL